MDSRNAIKTFHNLLTKENIKVVYADELTRLNTEELLSDKYVTPIHKHPNETIWNIITPAIAKELMN